VHKERTTSPHPSFERLLRFASEATAGTDRAIGDEVGLRLALGVSAGRFSNWKARGISQEGALLAERKFGCSANWVLYETGQSTADPAKSAVDPSSSPVLKTVGTVSESQWDLLQDFEMLIEEDREAIRKTLKEKANYARRVFDELRHRHRLSDAPATNARIEQTYGAPSPAPGPHGYEKQTEVPRSPSDTSKRGRGQ